MLSTGRRHLSDWGSRVRVSGIHTLKCFQNIYFLSSRCPAPAMPQQGLSLPPNIPTLPAHGLPVLAQSWPAPIPMAKPDTWRCSSAPSCPARGWMVGCPFNPHSYSTLAVMLLSSLKISHRFCFQKQVLFVATSTLSTHSILQMHVMTQMSGLDAASTRAWGFLPLYSYSYTGEEMSTSKVFVFSIKPRIIYMVITPLSLIFCKLKRFPCPHHIFKHFCFILKFSESSKILLGLKHKKTQSA